MKIAAEISLYPLRKPELSSRIERFVSVLRQRGLDVSIGTLSSKVFGESDEVFAALSEAYELVAEDGTTVLLVKMANVSPELDDTLTDTEQI